MARNLTEKQQKFLDVLFEEAQGNPVTAKKLAGYSENNPTSAITSSPDFNSNNLMVITYFYL